jgi:hypothetical protein
MAHPLSGGLKDAMEQYGKNVGDESDSAEHGEAEAGHRDDLHSVHHLNHKESGMHSVHKIGHDGKAESSSHKAGEMKGECPLCGGTGAVGEK